MSLSIKIIGQVFEKSERAAITREVAIGLQEMGMDVLLSPLDKPTNETPLSIGAELLQKIEAVAKTPLQNKFVSIFMTAIEGLIITDNDALANIPWVFSEFDKISHAQTLTLNAYPSQEIWVPTKAQKEVFERSGVRKKIQVVPFGVDTKRFNDSVSQIDGLRKEGHYYFGMHTNLDPISGFDIALSSFYNQFKDNDNVHLIWKTAIVGGSADERKNAINQILAQNKGESKASVIAITEDMDEAFDASLFNTVDCYINPSRAVGIGNYIQRAMASGKPVICNINTGNKSYTNYENSLPLTSSAAKVSDLRWAMTHPLYQDVVWYHISPSEMMSKMEDASKGNIKESIGQKAKSDMSKLSWDNVLLEALKELKKYEVLK